MTNDKTQDTDDAKAKTLVVVSSVTGNTRIVGHALADALSFAPMAAADKPPQNLDAYDTVLLGFWCDKGDAPQDMYAFAKTLKGKRIACFATMGADPTHPRALAWMEKTSRALVDQGTDNTLAATFLCQGRIDPAIFERMTAMLGGKVSPEREAGRRAAQTHPDRMDVLKAIEVMREALA